MLTSKKKKKEDAANDEKKRRMDEVTLRLNVLRPMASAVSIRERGAIWRLNSCHINASISVLKAISWHGYGFIFSKTGLGAVINALLAALVRGADPSIATELFRSCINGLHASDGAAILEGRGHVKGGEAGVLDELCHLLGNMEKDEPLGHPIVNGPSIGEWTLNYGVCRLCGQANARVVIHSSFVSVEGHKSCSSALSGQISAVSASCLNGSCRNLVTRIGELCNLPPVLTFNFGANGAADGFLLEKTFSGAESVYQYRLLAATFFKSGHYMAVVLEPILEPNRLNYVQLDDLNNRTVSGVKIPNVLREFESAPPGWTFATATYGLITEVLIGPSEILTTALCTVPSLTVSEAKSEPVSVSKRREPSPPSFFLNTVLYELRKAHASGRGLLPFVGSSMWCELRLINTSFRASVVLSFPLNPQTLALRLLSDDPSSARDYLPLSTTLLVATSAIVPEASGTPHVGSTSMPVTDVPTNCVELKLERFSELVFPRFLRGGLQPSCLRSTLLASIEQQCQCFSQKLFGIDGTVNDESPRPTLRRGIIGDLDFNVPPSPTLFLRTSPRISNPGDIVALYAVAKTLIADGYILVRNAMELYARKKHEFLSDIRDSFPLTHSEIFISEEEGTIRNCRDFLLSSLSVIQVAVRLRHVAAASCEREDWGLALLVNPVSMTSLALEQHLEGFYRIYDAAVKRRSEVLSLEDYRILKMLVPPDSTALLDFLLTKVGVEQSVLVSLGITETRSISVNKRFALLVSETAPRIRTRITHRLAAIRGIPPSDVSQDSVRAAMRRASKSHCLLKNSLLVAAGELRRVSVQMPELCEILQNAARVAGGISKTGCEGSYGTPTDAIILQAAWGSTGGQIDRLTYIAQYFLAKNGLSRERSAIAAALKEYEVRFQLVKHTLTPLRLEQYYCAHRIKTQRQLATLFSAVCRRVSCDASKLYRCNALCNTGGAMTMTVQADTVRGPDHDQGGDHMSKLGAFGVLVEASLLDSLDPALGLFPEGFNAADSIAGWTESGCTMTRPGLACVLGHVERLGGETAARNWQDRLEVIATYPEEFYAKQGGIVPILFFEEDNAKGCRDKSARFCLLIFADILSLDYVDDASNAAENSKYHSVEGLWGATRHRTGGAPIMLDITHWASATEEEKLEASEKALSTLMERFDGATFNSCNGIVNANKAGSVATDFVFRENELKEFCELNPGPGFNGFAPMNEAQRNFTCAPMPGYDGDPAEVYRRSWRKATSSGEQQCFFLHLNAMTYASNPLNVDCTARRAPRLFWQFLAPFSATGATVPQGVPSIVRPGKLMRLDERIAATTRIAETSIDNLPDAHHPVRKFADIDNEMRFVQKAGKGEHMSEWNVTSMARELCVEEAVVHHHMKVAVFKDQRKASRDVLKKDQIDNGKKRIVGDYTRAKLGLAPVTKLLKSGVMKTRLATVNKTHLLQALALLGIGTGKKNREVTEAHVPKLIQMIFDKANLSTAAAMESPGKDELALDGGLDEVDREIAEEAELSDDDIADEEDDDGVGDDEEDIEEEDVREEGMDDQLEVRLADIASRLEEAVGAGVGRVQRIRKPTKIHDV